MNTSTFLTEQQLSELLNVSVRTLQGDRQRGGGIPFVKIGRSVRYDWSKVQEHLRSCTKTSTSDSSAAA
jgi:excisionase family DNA binding protein